MKEMMKKVKERREGFTMAELLIVVAIIAVLVAIAIPVFNSQLEKSREATDIANMRDAYAVITADLMAPDSNIANHNVENISYTAATLDSNGNITTPASAEVTLTQTIDEWQTASPSVAGQALTAADAAKGGTYKIAVNKDTGVPTFTYTAPVTTP